ncbi:MAG: 50S ribosomal protein L24 [Bacteroidia bacterium]|nr:50S ribosomal protein L24 [Bacteroidia bacterium]MCZ2247748.1 50S ribosomal protein L24 [Bacteroidia bacterium]
MQVKTHIKKGDTVKVIAGDAKGQQGKVLVVDRSKMRAIVEGINLVSKHAKPSNANPQGGIIKQESSIHISNLMLMVGNTATKVGRKKNSEGKLVRYAKKSGEVIK